MITKLLRRSNMKLVNIGYGNMLSSKRIIAIVSPDAAPVKRMVQNARDSGMLIDASCGRKTKSVIITDSDHVVLSAVQTETIAHRIEENGEEILASIDDDDEFEVVSAFFLERMEEALNSFEDDEE